MAITKKIIGRIPICFGAWYPKQSGWGIKNRVTMCGSEFESLHDNNTVPPAIYDETENTVTFNENDWRIISNGTEAWLADAKINALGTWEETNPEFLGICLDKNDRLLFGVQKDGNFLFGAGVPKQIIEYISSYVESSINNIEAFLDGLENDKTLKEYLDETYGYYYEENPEFIDIKLDNEGHIIWGVRKDGDIMFGCGIPSEIQNAINKLSQDIDANFGDIRNTFYYIENPEYLFACLDGADKFLYGVTREGKFRAASFDFDITIPEEEAKWLNTVFSLIGDPEGRIDLTVDNSGKILSWRDKQGVKHETSLNVENKLTLSKEAMNDFQQSLKDSGFNPGGTGDWSDAKSIEIPMPRCAIVNISAPNGNAVWPTAKGTNYNYYIEFWDMQGNYFKKEIIFDAQGRSSLGFEKKNGAIDICNNNGWDDDDTFSIKFGDWVAQDSFHLKSYYNDFFRGVNVAAYELCNIIWKDRGFDKDRPWKKALIDFSTIDPYSTVDFDNDMSLQMDNGARCMPDGFPTILYMNGEFYGIYIWQLKKHRDNYHMGKSKAEHIHLDGNIAWDKIFGANGDISKIDFNPSDWAGFEIRNPKDLWTTNGIKYDGDASTRQEPVSTATANAWIEAGVMPSGTEVTEKIAKQLKTTGKVQKYLLDLSKVLPTLKTMEDNESSVSEIKAYIEDHFDVENIVDYIILSTVIYNWDGARSNWQWTTWDGVKWYICPYDMDNILGSNEKGNYIFKADATVFGNNLENPIGWIVKYYGTELLARWAELKGTVITADTIINIIKKWMDRIGQENYEKEWEKWPNTPCNRDSNVNAEYWEFAYDRRDTAPTTRIWDSEKQYVVYEGTSSDDNTVWFSDSYYWYKFRCVKAHSNQKPILNTYSGGTPDLGFHDNIWRAESMAKHLYDGVDEALANAINIYNN